MLEDTLVVWACEFCHTSMRENLGGRWMKVVRPEPNPFALTVWMAGGGVFAKVGMGQAATSIPAGVAFRFARHCIAVFLLLVGVVWWVARS
jgi:hypothetical protein